MGENISIFVGRKIPLMKTAFDEASGFNLEMYRGSPVVLRNFAAFLSRMAGGKVSLRTAKAETVATPDYGIISLRSSYKIPATYHDR